MSEHRCPQCNYGPVRADAITCVRCGKVFPRAADPLVDLPCERCGKKYALKKSIAVERVVTKKARCQACGGTLLLPKDVVDAAAAPRIEVATPAPCTCCERLARPDAVCRDRLVCGFCGMRFRVGQDTTAHVDGPYDVDAATATARVSTSGMPDTAVAGIVKMALVARARRGELDVEEATRIPKLLRLLDGWRATARLALPIGVDDAIDFVFPAVIQGRPLVGVDAHGKKELVYSRELEGGPDTAGRARIAAYAGINAIGLAALAATGSGFVVLPGSSRRDDVNHQVVRTRVSFLAVANGATIQIRRQLNEQTPNLLPPAGERALADALFQRRAMVMAYVGLAALFGPHAKGTPIQLATKAAIERRIVELEPTFQLPEVAAAQLRFQPSVIDLTD